MSLHQDKAFLLLQPRAFNTCEKAMSRVQLTETLESRILRMLSPMESAHLNIEFIYAFKIVIFEQLSHLMFSLRLIFH